MVKVTTPLNTEDKKGIKVDANSSKAQADEPSSNKNTKKRVRRERKVNALEHAKQVYEKLQQQKKEQREKDKIEREQRNQAIQQYNNTKKKMNRAVKKRNRKGQPNLGAQVEVLLEKMQRKAEKNQL